VIRRAAAGEAVGVALLLLLVVGSGIAVDGLPGAAGLAVHAAAVGTGLGAIVAVLGPVSGAHLNPAVTLAVLRSGRIGPRAAFLYVLAQVVGGIVGVAAARTAADLPPLGVSTMVRAGGGAVLSEVLATFGLVLVILVLVRTGRSGSVAPAVGAWVAAGIVATPSTGFANPAVTVARVLTDTATGISPGSAAVFVAAQLVGAALAGGAAGYLVPDVTPSPSPSR